MTKRRGDKVFFLIVLLLVTIGFIIFFSASQSLLSRSSGALFERVAIKQFLILLLGLVGLIGMSHLPFRHLRTLAFWIFLGSILLNLLVFVPGIGFGAGGARRWISLFSFTFQPSELLKFGYVLYWAYWLSTSKPKEHESFWQGILPFCVITAIPALILLAEPDNGTFIILFIAGVAMFLVSGARWRHLVTLLAGLVLLVGSLAVISHIPGAPDALTRKFSYIEHRFTAYLNPEADVLGKSFQINQSLIAIGSGGVGGRGFGQSVQKFNFLPEAIGDSVFAVAGEEFGFIGSSLIVILYALFALWGIKISSYVTDRFGRLLVVGLVILIVAQAFINISSMLGLIPLTGVPLTFISQGGSALIIALLEIGIILGISKYRDA